MRTRVKICGLTNLADALVAVNAGVDALGFILAESPRQLRPDQVKQIIGQLPPLVLTVGVFVNTPAQEVKNVRDFCGLDMVQLHGLANDAADALLGGPRRVIRVQGMSDGGKADPEAHQGATLLLDTAVKGLHGGTGKVFDWGLAVEAARQRPLILAGGLNPDNVQQAINTVRPYAVDVSSGLEMEPGRKDHDKIASFVRRAHNA